MNEILEVLKHDITVIEQDSKNEELTDSELAEKLAVLEYIEKLIEAIESTP